MSGPESNFVTHLREVWRLYAGPLILGELKTTGRVIGQALQVTLEERLRHDPEFKRVCRQGLERLKAEQPKDKPQDAFIVWADALLKRHGA